MKTILVVDDEYALLEALTDVLEEVGYRVISAGNGEVALTRLENERPDLILTDFMMPLVDGLELTRRVSAMPALSEVPVVMMSAIGKRTMLAKTKSSVQLAGFLDKPFELDELLELIARLIGKGAQ